MLPPPRKRQGKRGSTTDHNHFLSAMQQCFAYEYMYKNFIINYFGLTVTFSEYFPVLFSLLMTTEHTRYSETNYGVLS